MTLIYVPWFNDVKQTPRALRNILWKDNISELNLPWHDWDNKEIEYSLSSTSNILHETLTNQWANVSWIITWSISAWPVLEAILQSENYVEEILLINPAFNPVACVSRMYNCNPKLWDNSITTQDDFLGENDDLYTSLVDGKVKWNAKQFRKDLHRFEWLHWNTNTNFLSTLDAIRQRWHEVRVLLNPHDEVIFGDNEDIGYFWEVEWVDDTLNGRESNGNENVEAFYSHLPNFTETNRSMVKEFFKK